MRKKKIYLAGKISGLSRIEVSQKFGLVEKSLLLEGYEVINPLNIVDKDESWQAAMRKCIKALMDCDEVYFMPCWIHSPGATVERELVKGMKIPFHPNSN